MIGALGTCSEMAETYRLIVEEDEKNEKMLVGY